MSFLFTLVANLAPFCIIPLACLGLYWWETRLKKETVYWINTSLICAALANIGAVMAFEPVYSGPPPGPHLPAATLYQLGIGALLFFGSIFFPIVFLKHRRWFLVPLSVVSWLGLASLFHALYS